MKESSLPLWGSRAPSLQLGEEHAGVPWVGSGAVPGMGRARIP